MIKHPVPEMMRFIVFHIGIGFALSIMVTILIVMTDFSGIGTLIASNEDGPFAATIMVLLMGFSFSSIQLAVAIMLKAEKNTPPPDDQGARQHVRQEHSLASIPRQRRK